jgi:hypothetical protein
MSTICIGPLVHEPLTRSGIGHVRVIGDDLDPGGLGLFGHGHERVGVIGRDDDGIRLLRHQVIDYADLFVGIRDARSRVEKVDGHALPLQLGHRFFGALLGRGEIGRASEFGDHEDHALPHRSPRQCCVSDTLTMPEQPTIVA